MAHDKRRPVHRFLSRRDRYGPIENPLVDSRADVALTVLPFASVLLSAGSDGFAVVTLPQQDEFSSISLLVESEDGELVADEYPTKMDAEETEELIVAVDNNEYRSTEYTLVADEQSLDSDTATNLPLNEIHVRRRPREHLRIPAVSFGDRYVIIDVVPRPSRKIVSYSNIVNELTQSAM